MWGSAIIIIKSIERCIRFQTQALALVTTTHESQVQNGDWLMQMRDLEAISSACIQTSLT